jgi:hypothetical protein
MNAFVFATEVVFATFATGSRDSAKGPSELKIPEQSDTVDDRVGHTNHNKPMHCWGRTMMMADKGHCDGKNTSPHRRPLYNLRGDPLQKRRRDR